MEWKMEISGIQNTFSFLFPASDMADGAKRSSGDIVDVNAPAILSDDEVEGVFNETMELIGANPAAALSAHSGLSESRVFALLGA